MDEGSASRTISVQVDPHAVLYYYPQPVIPFAQSSFTSTMTIHLADETSRLFLLEIISCGRNAHEERFQYRRFASKVQIFRGQKLIYRDNTSVYFESVRMNRDDIFNKFNLNDLIRGYASQ